MGEDGVEVEDGLNDRVKETGAVWRGLCGQEQCADARLCESDAIEETVTGRRDKRTAGLCECPETVHALGDVGKKAAHSLCRDSVFFDECGVEDGEGSATALPFVAVAAKDPEAAFHNR
jgi:hypothetical protein